MRYNQQGTSPAEFVIFLFLISGVVHHTDHRVCFWQAFNFVRGLSKYVFTFGKKLRSSVAATYVDLTYFVETSLALAVVSEAEESTSPLIRAGVMNGWGGLRSTGASVR